MTKHKTNKQKQTENTISFHKKTLTRQKTQQHDRKQTNILRRNNSTHTKKKTFKKKTQRRLTNWKGQHCEIIRGLQFYRDTAAMGVSNVWVDFSAFKKIFRLVTHKTALQVSVMSLLGSEGTYPPIVPHYKLWRNYVLSVLCEDVGHFQFSCVWFFLCA